jgi:hypothetical protein
VPYVVEFLESIEHPENLVDLVLVTNANSYNKRMFDVLTRFKMVNVTISLEGVDQLNEMIRFNSSWKQINENIMRYKAMSNVFISINHVLQAFSVKTFVPLLHWCESMQLRLGLTVLDGPHYLRLNSVLPPVIEQFKLDLIEAKSTVVLNQHIIDSILKLINDTYQFDVYSLTKRKKYTILLDDLRKTKLSSII